ncbi:MAG: MFS transporter [Actinobacteria bacterium]|nr:MFS transporter [Actinomycetota bacterium]
MARSSANPFVELLRQRHALIDLRAPSLPETAAGALGLCQALPTMSERFPERGHRTSLRHLLRHRSFRLLLTARLLGQTGDGLLQGALVGYSLFSPEKQATAAGIAAAFALLLLPYSVLGPFVGVLIDRIPRRRVIATGNAARAVFAVAIGVSVLRDAPYAVLIPLVLLALAANRMVLTSHAAAIACTVTAQERVGANSLAPTVGSGASAVATVVSPGLVKLLGDDAAATAVTIVFVAAVWISASAVISRVGRDVLGPHHGSDADALEVNRADDSARPAAELSEQPVQARAADSDPEPPLHPLRDITTGLRTLMAYRSAARAIGIIAVHRALFGFTLLLTIMHARSELETRPGSRLEALAGVAAVGALAAVGTLIGAALAPRVVRAWGPIPTGGLGLAVAGIIIPIGWWYGMAHQLAVMYAAAPMIGISYAAIRVSSDTIVQSVIADDTRGRVFSVYDILMNVSMVTGISIGALALDSRNVALFAAAAFVALLAGAYARSSRLLNTHEAAAIAATR